MSKTATPKTTADNHTPPRRHKRRKNNGTYTLQTMRKHKGRTLYAGDPAKVFPDPVPTASFAKALKWTHRSGPWMTLKRHPKLRKIYKPAHVA